MARKKRSLDAPPVEWVDHLETNADQLRRIRMLWRRGAGDYRPIVPFDIDLDELELGPDSEWHRLELPETHFEWDVDEHEDDDGDPRERVRATVDELWRLATAWTRQLGGWCDFQLVGYGDHDEVLFEDGKRCWPSRPRRHRHDDHEQAAPSPDFAGFGQAVEQLDARKDKFIERLISDRDWSFDTAQQATSSAPALIEQLGEILKDTTAYQRNVVEQLRDQTSGRVEFRARAFAEMEKSRRTGMAMQLGKYAIETAVSAGIPFANRLFELLMNRNMIVFPEFTRAQQAMAYLRYSLSVPKLCKMFEGNREAAGAALALLDDGSQMTNEREALDHIEDLIMLLRSETFEQIAGPEEQLAARYIIGRYAMYRMGDYGEEN